MKCNRGSAICLALVIALAAGCGGRTAQPTSEYKLGDESKSCELLRAEINQCRSEVTRRYKEVENTQGKNAALGVAGAILFWPALFFMDLSDADQIELNAMIKRHDALAMICAQKHCGFVVEPLPPPPPPTSSPDNKEF